MCLLFLLLAIILSFWLYFWGVMCSDCGTAKPVYLARERLLNRLEWCLNFVNICIYFIQLEKKKKWRKRKRNFCRVTHEHELPWSTRSSFSVCVGWYCLLQISNFHFLFALVWKQFIRGYTGAVKWCMRLLGFRRNCFI